MSVLAPTFRAGVLVAFLVGLNNAQGGPIPQDPERQEARFRDLLEWNRKTLGGAYQKAGRKDPGWDKPAADALEAAARLYGRSLDPVAKPHDIFEAAKRAVEAGCDDTLILYLYASTSRGADDPGQGESAKRWAAASAAAERSDYSPLRRAVTLSKAGLATAERKGSDAAGEKEAYRVFDAALALVPKAAAKEDRNIEAQDEWFEVIKDIVSGYRILGGDFKAAFARVDAVLAKAKGMGVTRLQAKADYLIRHAWEARGIGLGATVEADAGQKFAARLVEAYKVLTQAWKLEPKGTRTSDLMLIVMKGLGGEKAEMERWFARAMEADGNNAHACDMKMDWLDPKWHGSTEELLAFGRECRETKN